MTYEVRFHDMTFPHFVEDIVSGKRTLAHMVASFAHVDPPPDAAKTSYVYEEFLVGDLLFLRPSKGRDRHRRIMAILTKVDLVPLEITDADAALLNTTAATYAARWDALHPALAVSLRPIVWRLEWRYDLERIGDVATWIPGEP